MGTRRASTLVGECTEWLPRSWKGDPRSERKKDSPNSQLQSIQHEHEGGVGGSYVFACRLKQVLQRVFDNTAIHQIQRTDQTKPATAQCMENVGVGTMGPQNPSSFRNQPVNGLLCKRTVPHGFQLPRLRLGGHKVPSMLFPFQMGFPTRSYFVHPSRSSGEDIVLLCSPFRSRL
jgi:hypothetical protein